MASTASKCYCANFSAEALHVGKPMAVQDHRHEGKDQVCQQLDNCSPRYSNYPKSKPGEYFHFQRSSMTQETPGLRRAEIVHKHV